MPNGTGDPTQFIKLGAGLALGNTDFSVERMTHRSSSYGGAFHG
jgi:hypothetical protein